MYNPQVGQQLALEGTTWQVVQHPGAPGMPYGQEGRAAIVFQLCSSQHRYTHPVLLLGPGGSVFEVPADGSALRLGRGPDNDAVLSEAGVSREHGALVSKDGKLYAWDNSSRNGTFVDGQKIDPQQWIEVPAGSRLQLGTAEEGAVLAVRPDASFCRGLKAFKARFRLPGLDQLAGRLAVFADLPGLSVCRRSVLTPQTHADLLAAEPDLLYAVVMPWVEGRSWMEMVMDRNLFSPEGALQAARQLTEVLASMEQRGVAHCDISGPNVNIELSSSGRMQIHLVDVEQLFGPGLTQPDDIFAGSPGYAHKSLGRYAWSAESDRFSGAIMLCEMLAWCDSSMAKVAWSESFFDPNEMQTLCARSQEMRAYLSDRWGSALARLFDQAWSSDSPAQCPTFAQWQQALPTSPGSPPPRAAVVAPAALAETAPVSKTEAAAVVASAQANAFMDQARRLEEAGDLPAAVAAYRQAIGAAGPDSATGREVALIVAELERKTPPPPAVKLAPPVVAPAPVVAPVVAPAPVPSGSAKVKADPDLVARIRELEGAPGIAPVAPPKPVKQASKAPLYGLVLLAVALLIGFFAKYGASMRASGDMTVSFVEPAAGTTLQGPLLLRAGVDNQTGKPMDAVVFYVDEKPVGQGNLENGAYQVHWDGKVGPGSHAFKVVARSSTGLERSATLSLQAPSPARLTVAHPAKGKDTLKLSAKVENVSVPVTEVVFQVDGKDIGSDKEAPYEVSWDSSALPPGPVHVRASATFQDGTKVESEKSTLELLQTQRGTLYVTVTDSKGGFPPALKPEHVRVKEDGVVQGKVTVHPCTAEDAVSAVLLLDRRDPNPGDFSSAIKATQTLVDRLGPSSRVAVVTFSTTPTAAVLENLAAGTDKPGTPVYFSSDRFKLNRALANLAPTQGSALYDCLFKSCELLAFRPGRRVIVVVTDGKDDNGRGTGPASSHTLEQVVAEVRRGGVTLYVVGLGKNVDGRALSTLAESSGGRSFLLAKLDDLSKAYADVVAELGSQFVLSWQSSQPVSDGKWRRVEVGLVKKPGFVVRAQAGYQAQNH